MVAIGLGASSSAANPILRTVIARAGVLCDPDSLSFQIFDVTNETNLLAPVPRFGPHVVNLTTDKIGPGQFAAAWTVGSGAPQLTGAHDIVWTAVLDGVTYTWRRRFDVLTATGAYGRGGYLLVSDMRAEDITSSMASDARLLVLNDKITKQIDRWLGRWFEPRALTIEISGTGKQSLGVEHPIVALASITTRNSGAPVDLASVRIFNRHIAGQVNPDDRDAPRVAWDQSYPVMVPIGAGYYGGATENTSIWPRGRANVEIVGVFGYTDPDGSFEGETPEGIRQAARLLALRELPKLANDDDRRDAREGYRLISERTREQSYQLEGRSSKAVAGDAAGFTGDPDIDALLEAYVIPIRIGSA